MSTADSPHGPRDAQDSKDLISERKALGQAIRRARLRAKLSQVQLGEAAGYATGPGAGVAIANIEAGRTDLRDDRAKDRLERITTALKTTAADLEQDADRIYRDMRPDRSIPNPPVPSLQERAEKHRKVFEEYSAMLLEVTAAANAAHDDARDQFFLPFVRTAATITGAPAIPGYDPEAPAPDQDVDPAQTAAFRLRLARGGIAEKLSTAASGAAGGAAGAALGSGLGAGAAYATFTAAATWGTASTGAAISGLSGAAASNAVLALLGGGTLAAGGAGVAGGTALLAGVVGGPALLAAAAGAIWLAKRGAHKRNAELDVKLTAAEDELARRVPGYDHFKRLVSAATGVFTDIAVHGGRAQERWQAQLPPAPQWDQLTPAQRERYDDFIQIGAAQVSAATLEMSLLLTHFDEDLEQTAEVMTQVITQSAALVQHRV